LFVEPSRSTPTAAIGGLHVVAVARLRRRLRAAAT
jgi:hypothetical protein